ncbi:MAG: 16S rRNA (guanine(527)-N(7))-methyltransferase RsmG [Bacteroidetes bacterium]|nr:16S rRNA (guanine(527)-N(7))-methyltransferase RsmG [Bacteroidota bacterium]
MDTANTTDGAHTADSIRSLLAAGDVEVTDAQRDQLAAFVSLLRDWNSRINLISRKDEEQVWRNHILHSLAVMLATTLPREGAMLDLGTGGGMPGIPLAIMLPDVRFTLVDSIAKKIRAVEDMIAQLALQNVAVHCGRVEDDDLLRKCQGKMDVVLARAVTQLPALVRWSYPLLRKQGPRKLVVWKGGALREEIAEARRHGQVQSIRELPIVVPGEAYFEREEKKIIEVQFS